MISSFLVLEQALKLEQRDKHVARQPGSAAIVQDCTYIIAHFTAIAYLILVRIAFVLDVLDF